MRAMRGLAVLALVGARLPACSLLFDGSRFTQGGDLGDDGGVGEDGGEVDGGPTPGCDGISCAPDQYCSGGTCVPCDNDLDGYVGSPACDTLESPLDCDDFDPSVYPFAIPVCGDGVDQSCGTMVSGFPATELGFYWVQEVPVPPDGLGSDVSQLRVAAVSGDEALVFFQLRDDRRTIEVGRVPLVAAPQALEMPDSIDTFIDGLDPAAQLFYDVQRASDGQIHMVVLIENENFALLGLRRWVRVRDTLFQMGGRWSSGLEQSYDPRSEGFAGWQVVGNPALVSATGTLTNLALGVPAEYMESGAPRRTLFVLGVGSYALDVAGGEYDPLGAATTWAASDGGVAAFPGTVGQYLVWNGTVHGGAEDETQKVGAPSMLRARAAAFANLSTPVINVVQPSETGISLYQGDCATTIPFASCSFRPPMMVPLEWGGGDPLLVAFAGPLDARLNFAFVDRASGEDLPMFGYVLEGSSPVTFPLVSDGAGAIVDLDLDELVVPDGPGRGRALFVYAFARRNLAGEPAVYVGGAAACIGYSGP